MVSSSPTPRLPRYMGSQRSQIDAIGSIVRTHVLGSDAPLRKKHALGQAHAVDMCSGSGAVSRWLRQEGWVVQSLDIEQYAWHWNQYAMQTTCDGIAKEEAVYRSLHNLDASIDIVRWWNSLLPTLQAPAYFEEHYAPNEQCQRMYFMPHVARWLDQALFWHTSQDWSATPLLHAYFVSEICCAMIRAANTSGTMKSFHAQWGGSTNHRMEDIQTLPQLEPMWTLPGPVGSATVHDATQPWDGKADVVYFDPPASLQQFSSSYHLLNAFVQGHYKIPSATGKHGDKSGILRGAHSSAFSKKATVERAWQDWIKSVQNNASWLVVTYPKSALIPSEQAAMILQQHGKNTVTRHDIGDTFVYVVKTNQWQSPQQLKRMLCKVSPDPVLNEYVNPQKLAPRFTLVRIASKIHVYDQRKCVAIISKRYKTTWLSEPTIQDIDIWKNAQLSLIERFSQYLIDKQWLSALTALREMRKTCSSKKQYQEHWTMLYHLAQAHGMHAMMGRINAICWR